jgi:hypothetical protein
VPDENVEDTPEEIIAALTLKVLKLEQENSALRSLLFRIRGMITFAI